MQRGACMTKLSNRQTLFPGYMVVLGAWLTMFVTAGTQFSFSIFQPYLLKAFGWSRGMLSAGFTLNIFIFPIFGVLAGYLVDRIGPRLTVIIGVAVSGIAMVLLSTISQVWHFIILYGMIFPMGIGLSYNEPIKLVQKNDPLFQCYRCRFRLFLSYGGHGHLIAYCGVAHHWL